jgi:thiol-disulfide isomerase/thioredoxin
MPARCGSTVGLTILVALGWLSTQQVVAAPKAYEQLTRAAMSAEQSGALGEAYAHWQKLHEIAPESPFPSYSAATCAARLGRVDETFAWLDKAVASGYEWADTARADEDFSSLHDDVRWQLLLDNMQAMADRDMRLIQARRPDPDTAAAPVFKSARKLTATFDRRAAALDKDRWRLSENARGAAVIALADERFAAARRYINDHPVAKDVEAAAWDAVSHRALLTYAYYLPLRWGDAGRQIVEELDTFGVACPTSPHRAEALTYRAFAVFHVRAEGGTKASPWTDEDLGTLESSLGEIARQFSGTTPGGLALAWQLIVADMVSSSSATPEMRAIRTELGTTYAKDRDVAAALAYYGRRATLRMDGIENFEGTDLSGRRWNAASFVGKVTLIDFWATWCGPCVGQIPTVRSAWKAFGDRGLQIVGVSLDMDDRKSFEAWMRSNNVSWPQLWDGKGFMTPMARKFEVSSIPCTVLIGPDGRVADVDLRGEELVARIRELIEQLPAVPR